MSEQIMKLPTQDEFNTKKLAEWKLPNFQPLFNSNEFVPTGEPAATYQGNPEENDTCAWKEISHGDILTKCFYRASPWIEDNILVRWRYLFYGVKPTDEQMTSSMSFGHIVGAMDTLACLLASILLAVTIVVLAVVRSRPLAIRIVLISIFGTLFALLLKLMAGTPTRGEVFGATAAFYAVTAVFVSSANNDCTCS
jgi:hypothetical protein